MKLRHQKSFLYLSLGLGFFILMPLFLYTYADIQILKHKFPKRISDTSIIFENKRPINWVKVRDISPGGTWPIIISEDWAFYDHNGVDFNQLFEVFKGIFLNKEIRGASTITQQLAKNIFLGPEKTFIRKIREMFIAFKLEENLSKDEILEIYLNVIEFGPNVFGIGNASEYFFNKKPSELNFKEGSFLAMLLPNPKIYHSSFQNKKLNDYARTRVDITLQKLKIAKILNEEQLGVELERKLDWEL